MRSKKAWYRFGALFIVVGLIAGAPKAAASLEETMGNILGPDQPVTEEEASEGSDVVIGELPDNDTLFAGYAAQLFYGDGNTLPLANYGYDVLEGTELALYQDWKNTIISIAAKGGSSQMPVPADFCIPISADSETISEAQVKQTLTATLRRVIGCLMVDCPYEFYWYDKTVGYSYRYSSYTMEKADNVTNLSFHGLSVVLKVAAEYQSGSNTTVSGTKAQTTAAAVARAREIVTANEGKTDYEKLVSYKDEICSLVSYNYGALSGVSYGNPWQMIYVFDGDPSTNVVCEGYSKAFQYLCDMTDFMGEVVCYTVYGQMRSGSGGGNHMWNIVTLEGKNYLVDVTNSDSGTIGQNGGLFLAGGTGSVSSGYQFSAGATYIYDPEQKDLYKEELLTLASTGYVPLQPGSITNLSMESWVYGSSPNMPIWDTTNGGVTPVVEYKEKGAGNETYTTETPSQAGDYIVKVCYPQTDQYSSVCATAEFTITAKSLTQSMVRIEGEPFFYTGQEIRPAVVQDGMLLTDQDYDILYTKNIAVGNEAEVTVTGKGNYQGTMKKTFSISYIDPPQDYLAGRSGMNHWYTSDVTIYADGWSLSGDGTASFTDTMTCSQEGITSLLLYFKHHTGSYLTEAQNISLFIDKTAPTGRIQVMAAEWENFLETVTFRHYSAENRTVTIIGEDSVSGVMDIEYYISGTPMTVQELQALTSWTEYQETAKPKLLENSPQVVYAKIRDHAGNISYLSTDGIIIDGKNSEEIEKDPLLKPIIHEDFSDIPLSLAEAGFDTVEKIRQEMDLRIQEHGYPVENGSLYDVKPLVSHDNGATWTPAATEDFPREGLQITIPYPQGTSQKDCQFFAAHMFSHEMNGFRPGDIEIPSDIKNTPEGIQFTVYGLSPIAIAWKETTTKQEPDKEENNGSGNNSSGNNSSGNNGSGNDAKASGIQGIPRTGDASNLWLYELCLLSSAIGIECLAICSHRRKKEIKK